MNIPSEPRYTAKHVWALQDVDKTVRVGVTDYAQNALGDLVYADLPEPGRRVAADEEVASLESVKTAASVFSPMDGEILACNDALSGAPEVINHAPYQAWLFKLRPSHPEQYALLLDSKAYRAVIGEAL